MRALLTPLDLVLPRDQKHRHPWLPHLYSRRQVDARLAGIGLLELTAMLLDPVGWSCWRKHPPVEVPIREEESPAPPPVPQPFPIELDTDRDKEIASNLRLLEDDLRWVVVALYNALGHVLAKHRPMDYVDDPGRGQLTRLFDAVARRHPQVPRVRKSVETAAAHDLHHIERDQVAAGSDHPSCDRRGLPPDD